MSNTNLRQHPLNVVILRCLFRISVKYPMSWHFHGFLYEYIRDWKVKDWVYLLMAVGVKITAFWDRTPFNLVDIYEYFEGISCLRQSKSDTSNARFRPTTRQLEQICCMWADRMWKDGVLVCLKHQRKMSEKNRNRSRKHKGSYPVRV